MEQVLLKGIEGEDASEEIEEMKKSFGDDVDVMSLSTELEVSKSICKKNKPSHTLEIIEVLKQCNRDNSLSTKNSQAFASSGTNNCDS